MSTVVDISDITIHLHPDCSCDGGDNVEQTLRAVGGVISVRFDAELHPHAMIVAYNPELISSTAVLEVIRTCDPRAVKVSL